MSQEMLEVEMKFPGADFALIEQRLMARNAKLFTQVREADHYFNAPDRDFAKTDEALRLRRVGSSSFVTYKGPKRDLQTKTRVEIEVPLAAGDRTAEEFMLLLTHLGYRPVHVVQKLRRIYNLECEGLPMEVCLDEVDNLGRFVELEIRAPADRLETARAVLLRSAAELGLSNSERRSYLELLLNKIAASEPSSKGASK